MKNKLLFSVGMFFGGMMLSCAAVTFPYHPYGVDPENDLLLGPTPADDRKLSEMCQPDDVTKGKCLVYLLAEHEKMKADYLKVKQDLQDCQASQ